MMLGARTAAWRGANMNNPYITDGLVCHIDGEWNAGIGKHDDSVQEWIDLSGNGNVFIPTTNCLFVWGENYLDMSARNYTPIEKGTYLGGLMAMPDNSPFTFECVFRNFSGRGVTTGNPIACNGQTNIFYGTKFATEGWSGTGNVTVMISNGKDNIIPSSSPLNPNTDYGLSFAIDEQSCVFSKNGIQTSLKISLGTLKKYNHLSIFGWANGKEYYNCSASRGYSMRLYNRVLTAEEIAANYEIDKSRFGIP